MRFFRYFQASNGTANVLEESDYYSEDQDTSKISHKPFFRRLSFKGLRKGKVIKLMVTNLRYTLEFGKNCDANNDILLQSFFQKQHSDEQELSGQRQSKTKLAKIVVECRKEGIVNYIPPETLDQPSAQHKWEKCKLVLVKTVGGYMLEFYSPPKAPKVSAKSKRINFCWVLFGINI